MIVRRLSHLKDWYEHNERRVSSLSLIAGFIFDSLTLQRVDSLFENLWSVGNLVVVGVCIVLLHRHENTEEDREDVDHLGDDPRMHFWLFNIMQFSFGALLGASFIFYFRSATLSVSWPFLALVLVAMFANEFLKKHYDRLLFQISFLYLSIFIFLIYFVPVIIHRLGAVVFLASGVLSLIVLWGFIKILERFSKDDFKTNSRPVVVSVASIFLIINILYFTNIIPPIPLALKDAGIYHSVSRTASGGYAVTEDSGGWLDYLRLSDRVYWVSGTSLYAYSAVFSPTDLDTNIVHEWQYKDEETGGWIDAGRIPLRLTGGRAEGFRTYSVKSNLNPGKWRVNVVTPRGAVIGRINFKIISSSANPDREVRVIK